METLVKIRPARPPRDPMVPAAMPSGLHPAVQAGLVCVALITVMLLVDAPLARAVRTWPDALVGPARAIARYASGYAALGLSLAVTLVTWALYARADDAARLRRRRALHEALFVSAASLIVTLVGFVAKVLIGRSRPVLIDSDGPFAFHPLSTAEAMTSLPSGETLMMVAVCFSAFLVLRPRVGRWAGLLMVVPVMVGASRLAIGAHYLSDVVAAFLLAIALIAWLRDRPLRRLFA